MLLFYATTEPAAAKRDAELKRMEGGGAVDWRKESLRNHGQIAQITTEADDVRAALINELERSKDRPCKNYQEKMEKEKYENNIRRVLDKPTLG